MLSKTALWTGIDFENSASEKGDTQRTVGMIMMLISIVFLGIALFSTLIHIKNSKLIWFTGLAILFAGLYFSYHAEGVCFYSESTVSNTTILGASMMFYMLFLCILQFTTGIISDLRDLTRTKSTSMSRQDRYCQAEHL